jgi:hypothetical protein
LRRDGSDASGAERGHGAETVVDEIEAGGNGVKVSVRIEIKSGWLRRSYDFVEAGKAEPDQQIDAERSKDGFGIGTVSGEDVAENDHNNEQVKNQADDNVEYGKRAQLSLSKKDAVEQRRNGKENGKDEQSAVDFRRVNADENSGASDNEKSVVAEAAGLRIGKRISVAKRRRKRKKNRWPVRADSCSDGRADVIKA